MFERFTESARRVVYNAQKAARELGHADVGTEHELLGLLADPDSDASRALHSPGVTAERARERVIEIVPRGDQHPEGQIPFTRRAKMVLELSLREAFSLGHRNITPEHLLLGLARGLASLGVDVDATREAIKRQESSDERAG